MMSGKFFITKIITQIKQEEISCDTKGHTKHPHAREKTSHMDAPLPQQVRAAPNYCCEELPLTHDIFVVLYFLCLELQIIYQT